MVQLRRTIGRGAVFAIAVAFFAVGGLAQLPPDAGRTRNWMEFVEYFVAACPMGCRDVDAYLSCGSVEDVAACTLAVDGNVSLTCADGGLYTATMDGCHTGVNQTQLGVAVASNFELWTMRRFATNFGDNREHPDGWAGSQQEQRAAAFRVASTGIGSGGEPADPQEVADAIARAATDPSTPFRNLVGDDAKLIDGLKSSMAFEEFESTIRFALDWHD